MQFPTLTNQPDDKDDDHLQGQRMFFFCKVVPAAVDFNGCCQRPIVQAVERQLKPLPFIGLDSYAPLPLHPPTPTSPQTPTQTLSTPPPPHGTFKNIDDKFNNASVHFAGISLVYDSI